MYHSISSCATQKFRRYTVSPTAFADQVNWLRDNGFTALTVSQLRSAVEGLRALPHRLVVLTFDDGFADFYKEALPVLLSADFTATVYLVSGLTGRTSEWLGFAGEGSRELLTWSQVREMDSCGIEFGSHTRTHPDLDSIPRADAYRQVDESKRCIEDNIGNNVPSFAYPHGSYSPAVKRMVREVGYTSACAVKNRLSTAKEDPFALSRLEVHADIGIEAFGNMVTRPTATSRVRLPESLHTGIRRVVRRRDHIRIGSE